MSKFKAREQYIPEGSAYRLLPFRFARIADDEYFLTNEVGEGIWLTRNELTEFSNHLLDRKSAAFKNLKAKHFLLDADSNVAIDLLALKLRTKLSQLSQFTSLHIFVVSLRCEHSCPYCQVSRQSDDRTAFDMSEETANLFIDLTFRSPSQSIKIEFQGGEPLLNFELIKYVVERAVKKNKTHNRNLGFVIATNLALIDDDILAFCAQHKIEISTSLDGPRELHNSNRPRQGSNSYELAVSGIEKARLALGYDQVSALMTTTKKSLNLATEIVDEYIKLGFNGIFLRPLSPYGFAIKTKWYESYNYEEWLKFYFKGLDYIIDLNRNGMYFREYFALTILRKMLTPFETRYVDLMNPSGMGIAAVVYNYNGEIYASDESRMLAEMGDKKFLIGNIFQDSYEEIFTSEALLNPLEESFAKSTPMCSECAFEPYCGADPVFHYATQGDVVGNKSSSGFCNRNMAIFKHLIKLLRDEETKNILLSWLK